MAQSVSWAKTLLQIKSLKKIKAKDVDLVINLSASPFSVDKFKGRKTVCQKTALHFKAPIVYVNMVGAQDEIIYDGLSFVTSKTGKIVAKAHQFCEDILVYDTDLDKGFMQPTEKHKSEIIRQALVLGLRDFEKNWVSKGTCRFKWRH